MYSDYLNFLHQIVEQQRAHLELEGILLWIEKNPKGEGWKVSTEIAWDPHSSRKDWFLRDVLPWQRGSCLQQNKETGSILLVQDILPIKTFSFFKRVLQDFLSTAHEWRDIFLQLESV